MYNVGIYYPNGPFKSLCCIPHDLLIAKLEAYGLDKISLNIISDYLNNRKQRTKISSCYDIKEHHKDQF